MISIYLLYVKFLRFFFNLGIRISVITAEGKRCKLKQSLAVQFIDVEINLCLTEHAKSSVPIIVRMRNTAIVTGSLIEGLNTFATVYLQNFDIAQYFYCGDLMSLAPRNKSKFNRILKDLKPILVRGKCSKEKKMRGSLW